MFIIKYKVILRGICDRYVNKIMNRTLSCALVVIILEYYPNSESMNMKKDMTMNINMNMKMNVTMI